MALLVVASGCGAGIQVPDAREAAKATMTASSGDPAAVAALLHDSVALGQLAFDDAACAAAFPPGEVREDKFGELSRCLAGLKLRASTREDGLGDVAVMTYGAGFEVEARILRRGNEAHLTWIGFASQHAGSPMVPTLDPVAFEQLRLSGQRVPVLDATTAHAIEGELSPGEPGDVAVMWLKVCLDETGAITLIDPYEPPSYVAMDAFVAAAKAWTFRPFVHAGKAQAVCSMVRMAHPAAKAPLVETLPLPPPPSKGKRPPIAMAQRKFVTLMEGRRIVGERRIVPDDATKSEIAQYRASKITGTFRLCLDEAGHVESVLPMRSTGFPAYDRDLLAKMSLWKYSPYTIDGQPVSVCTGITFIYSQR